MNNKKVFLITGFISVMGIFLWVNAAFAATDTTFESAYEALEVTFRNARSVVYVLSGFGLIGLSVGAMMGKLDFKWLAMICVALAVLAGAEKIVKYSIQGVEIDEDYKGIGEEDFKLDLQFE